MFIEAVLIGLFLGGFKGGRLSNITEMNIRGWYLILLALLLQISPLIFGSMDFMLSIQKYILFMSSFIIMIVVLLNLDKKGVWIILLGGLFNLVIVAMNGFQMPVVMENLKSAGLLTMHDAIVEGNIVNYVQADIVGGFSQIFTKFVTIAKPYPMPKILTIGDIVMSLGLLYMIIGEMDRTSYYGKGKMIQYSYSIGNKRK